jgi:hypothetical protein
MINGFNPILVNSHAPLIVLAVPARFETLQSNANDVASFPSIVHFAIQDIIIRKINCPINENAIPYTIALIGVK